MAEPSAPPAYEACAHYITAEEVEQILSDRDEKLKQMVIERGVELREMIMDGVREILEERDEQIRESIVDREKFGVAVGAGYVRARGNSALADEYERYFARAYGWSSLPTLELGVDQQALQNVVNGRR